jgi:hypothetical protein
MPRAIAVIPVMAVWAFAATVAASATTGTQQPHDSPRATGVGHARPDGGLGAGAGQPLKMRPHGGSASGCGTGATSQGVGTGDGVIGNGGIGEGLADGHGGAAASGPGAGVGGAAGISAM